MNYLRACSGHTRSTAFATLPDSCCILLFAFFCVTASVAVSARPDFRALEFAPAPLKNESSDHRSSKRSDVEQLTGLDQYLPATYQPDVRDDANLDAAIAAHLADIENVINTEGPFSPTLEKDMGALAGLYQDKGEHARALDLFDRAIHISKINHGLYHPDQIPLQESSIQSLLAMGRIGDVEKQLDYLIYLNQKHYGSDSLEVIRPIAAKVAWDMALYEQALLAGDPAEFAMTTGFTGLPNGDGINQGVLLDTQELIIKAIQILVGASEFANPFLHKFEQQLIETYFYQAHHDEQTRATSHYVNTLDGSFLATGPFDYTKANYLNGEEAYQRLLAYLEKCNKQDSLEYVMATVGLADWYLLFDELEKSRDQYARASQLLDAGNFSDAQKQQVLQPEVPVALPAFGKTPLFSALRNGHSSAVIPALYKGYVDVSFDLSRHGRVTNVKVIGKSEGTPRYVSTELEWQIRDSRYRPRLSASVPQGSDALTLRYYYNY